VRLIAATRNRAKIGELQGVVGDTAKVEPLLQDISLGPEIERSLEAGRETAEIAAAKAVAWSRAVGEGALVIATDGGLLIPALGEAWDPTRTRRFAGEDATDLERARTLLALTADLTGEDRRIGWRESLAIARGGKLLATWSAEGPTGLLATEVDPAAIEAGGGFWIPAVWRCPELYGRLLADLTAEERSALGDHWTQLAGPVREWLSSRSSQAG
jgi:inosine/xanthosine triphosphate pyrophosphatase family protein